MIATTKTTVDRAEINRRNAQKSTGPRTPEGKQRSKFNAVKHGMTAKTVVLPGEDPQKLQIRLETWTDQLQPQNDIEQFLLEQAVHSSWMLERAQRAELARLSHLIASVPESQSLRDHEQAVALGFWLFSDRGICAEAGLQDNVLNVLGTAPTSARGPGHLDLLDHPEAIVFRLGTTPAGAQWMLDRWTELRNHLETGQAWSLDQKKKALRLLGRRPLGLDPFAPGDPLQWYGDAAEGTGTDRDDRESKARSRQPIGQRIRELLNSPVDGAEAERRIDAQLDRRLVAGEADTIAVLKSIADRAIGRLEAVAAEHRRLADADDPTARQSFDASNEGERLRRYQSSCSRHLFRNIDTFLKIRKSGVAVPDGGEPSTAAPEVPSPVQPQADRENPRNEPSDPPVDRVSPQDGATEDHDDPRAEMIGPAEAGTPTGDSTGSERDVRLQAVCEQWYGESPQADPAPARAAEIDHLQPPSLRTVIVALTLALVVLSGASAVARAHGKRQNEPRDLPVEMRNRQFKPTAAPRQAAPVHADTLHLVPRLLRGNAVLAALRPTRRGAWLPYVHAEHGNEDSPGGSKIPCQVGATHQFPDPSGPSAKSRR